MNPVALLTLVIAILQDAPELISVVQQDIADLSAGTLTVDQVQARWTAMQTAWGAAKARWAAAATPAVTHA